MKSNHSHPQNHTLILHQNVKAKIQLTMTKKSVLFNVPKEFNINDERVSVDELDSQINPYLHNDKHQHDPDDVAALPSPKELPQITAEPKRVRVGRPLRHVKHKPTKEVTYINNQIFPKFSYEKIKFPLKPNTLIVHVKYFAVNPIDLKIHGSNSSRLGDTDEARIIALRMRPAGFIQELWYLCRLTRTCFTTDNHNSVVSDSFHNHLFFSTNR